MKLDAKPLITWKMKLNVKELLFILLPIISPVKSLLPPIMFGQPSELYADNLGQALQPADFERALNISVDDAPLDAIPRVDPIELAGAFEGDIILGSLEEYELLTRENEKPVVSLRNAIINLQKRWPKGEIPYVISSTFTQPALQPVISQRLRPPSASQPLYITGSDERAMIANAIASIHKNTCIRFIPRVNQPDYIHILKGSGCSSSVGRVGGVQAMSLGSGCFHNLGIIKHELMHTIGFWHEHSRGDRDVFIQIIWSNILPGMKFNFNKYDWNTVQSLGIEYDLGSIMHYGPYAFAKDRSKPTILPRQRKEIGQRRMFSEKDLKKINLLYNCPGSTIDGIPCLDTNENCKAWAVLGECEKNPDWMLENCKISCNQCDNRPICKDSSSHCPAWANLGECPKNPYYMLVYCQKSCGSCL